MAQSRGYSSGKFALELRGEPAGFLRSVQGGEIFGTVITLPAGADGVAKKHIGEVGFEPITITFGVGMAPELYAWVTEVLERKQTPRDGAISLLNYDFTEMQRLEWKQGVITEVTFPAADASAKEAAFLTLTITADSTTLTPSSGKPQFGFSTKAQKQWLASNFRFSVSGLEAGASTVRRVAAFTIRQALVTGEGERGHRQLGTVDVSNLLVAVPLASAKPWLDWRDDFLTKGNVDDDAERTGTLQFLDQTAKNVLFTITLSHVGIVRARRQIGGGAVGVVAEVELELYCEAVTFSLGAETAGSVVSAQPPATPRLVASQPADAATRPVADTVSGLSIGAGPGNETEHALRLLRAASLSRNPEIVAARLKTTAVPVQPVLAQRARRADGESLGERWAAEHASLSELQQFAALENGEWTGIRLADEHTLVAQLRQLDVIPPGGEGPLQLVRDDFVEGLLTGAVRVLRAAQAHLGD
jgi:hypothetical protein